MSIDDEARTEPYSGDVEEEDTSGEPITEPFDPSKIRVREWKPTVSLLMTRIEEGELRLDPGFQRRAGIWKEEVQSRLVESLLIRIPLPSFYFESDAEERMIVVDGVQRLTSLRRFVVTEELRLTGLEFLLDHQGKTFSELPRHLQRRIQETQVTAYVIEAGTPPEAKFNIFRRINTGGVPLSAQEIRNALHQGPAVDLLRELAESDEFRDAGGDRIRPTRLAHHECILRFIAFALSPYERYRGPDLDSFLEESMKELGLSTSAQRADLAFRFRRALSAAYDLLGQDAFRKPPGGNGKRNPFNRALFEAWTVNLDRRSDQELAALRTCGDRLREGFVRLSADEDFARSISGGTGKVSTVRTRFKAIGDLIDEVLRCSEQSDSSTSSASAISASTSAS